MSNELSNDALGDDDYFVDNGGGGGDDDDGGGNGAGDDAMANFDIQECDTFGSLWMWDLSLSCSSMETLEDCECTFASELFEEGLLTCDDVGLCPRECGVCLTCLRLLGCALPGGKGGSSRPIRTRNIVLYVVGAAMGALVIIGVVYAVSKRRGDENSLGENLMDEPHVFLAPSNTSFDGPAMPPAQFEPAALAAVASQETFDQDVWLAPVDAGNYA